MSEKHKVTIRCSADILERMRTSYPNLISAIDAGMNGKITCFQLHVDEQNNQIYITFTFSTSGKASLFRGHYSRLLDEAGWNLTDIFELSSGEEPPVSAQMEVDFPVP